MSLKWSPLNARYMFVQATKKIVFVERHWLGFKIYLLYNRSSLYSVGMAAVFFFFCLLSVAVVFFALFCLFFFFSFYFFFPWFYLNHPRICTPAHCIYTDHNWVPKVVHERGKLSIWWLHLIISWSVPNHMVQEHSLLPANLPSFLFKS